MNANEIAVGASVVNKFGTKGEVIRVFSGGLVEVAYKGFTACISPAELTKACCDGASRDCLVHGDGN